MTDSKIRPIIIRKKIVKHAAHHGGSWKVAYADFATAMMSLFIVLWLMNSNAKVKDAVAGYFKDPAGVGKLSGTSTAGRDKTVAPQAPPTPIVEHPKPSMDRLKNDLEKAIRNLPNAKAIRDNVIISVTDEGVRMELIETAKGLFFLTGSVAPTAAGKTVLTTVSAIVGKLPNRVVIEGHTDAVPFVGDTTYSNWELSSERANASRVLMTSSGLRPNQLFEIRGFADQQLRLPAKPGDPSNRRISIIVLNSPETTALPAK